MFGLGIGELLVVLVIVLVVFGAGRLPEVMGSMGKGVQAFKKGLREPPEIDVTPTDEQRDIWNVMIGAREACKLMLKPGTAVADLYRSYVTYLRDRGIEPTLKFLGHGIGQTIHEEPYITETRTVVLEPNITCTMEPLYMIPGRMGFHVEDMYRITPTGFEAMTGAITPNDELIRIG